MKRSYTVRLEPYQAAWVKDFGCGLYNFSDSLRRLVDDHHCATSNKRAGARKRRGPRKKAVG